MNSFWSRQYCWILAQKINFKLVSIFIFLDLFSVGFYANLEFSSKCWVLNSEIWWSRALLRELSLSLHSLFHSMNAGHMDLSFILNTLRSTAAGFSHYLWPVGVRRSKEQRAISGQGQWGQCPLKLLSEYRVLVLSYRSRYFPYFSIQFVTCFRSSS